MKPCSGTYICRMPFPEGMQVWPEARRWQPGPACCCWPVDRLRAHMFCTSGGFCRAVSQWLNRCVSAVDVTTPCTGVQYSKVSPASTLWVLVEVGLDDSCSSATSSAACGGSLRLRFRCKASLPCLRHGLQLHAGMQVSHNCPASLA